MTEEEGLEKRKKKRRREKGRRREVIRTEADGERKGRKILWEGRGGEVLIWRGKRENHTKQAGSNP